MSTVAFIIGMLILSIFTLVAAFIIAGAITAAGSKNNGDSALRQPEMKYFNDFDAADYLGITTAELQALREQNVLDGVFSTILTTDEGGTEEYYDVDSAGREVVRTRPVTVDAVRYVYSKELLDARMNELMKDGKTLNVR